MNLLERWPKGKYNGKRIAGFALSFKVNLFWWDWRLRLTASL
jgi:hypothetical protein